MSRISFLVSGVLAVLLAGTFFADALPMPVRTWIAQTIPGGSSYVRLPPDPGEEIRALIDRMDLTADGRLLFERSRPVIVDDLEELCGASDTDDDMTTLGCYHGFGRIYLLRDVVEFGRNAMLTIAAHELLHAAYDELSLREREQLARLLTTEVDRIDRDDPVHAQIEASVGGDESLRSTEQFAYLGSQVVLPGGFAAELEQFYARWFIDRETLASHGAARTPR